MFRAPGEGESPEEVAAYRAALQQPPDQRAAAKKAAQEACSAEELELLKCYREGSFIACAGARHAFWTCFKQHRVRGAT